MDLSNMYNAIGPAAADPMAPESANCALVAIEYLEMAAVYAVGDTLGYDQSIQLAQDLIRKHPEWIYPAKPHLFAMGPDDMTAFFAQLWDTEDDILEAQDAAAQQGGK